LGRICRDPRNTMEGCWRIRRSWWVLFRLTSGIIRDRRLQVYHAAGVGSRNRRQNKLKPRFRRIRGCATHQGYSARRKFPTSRPPGFCSGYSSLKTHLFSLKHSAF
jgi:hypothetical protein